MNKIFLVVILCFFLTTFQAQSYLGWVTHNVNLRKGAVLEYKIFSSLNPGAQIFIVSLEDNYGFANIIDIASNKEGYVSKSFIEQADKVEISQDGIFQPTDATSNYKPEIKIFNNTVKTLTLKLNDIIYTFASGERKSYHFDPGVDNYKASEPGVIPNLGMENL